MEIEVDFTEFDKSIKDKINNSIGIGNHVGGNYSAGTYTYRKHEGYVNHQSHLTSAQRAYNTGGAVTPLAIKQNEEKAITQEEIWDVDEEPAPLNFDKGEKSLAEELTEIEESPASTTGDDEVVEL